MTWTAETEVALRRMWEDGMSAGRIAHQIGTVTRSAVLGKVRRMRLPFRDASKRVRPAQIRARARPAPELPTQRHMRPPLVPQPLPVVPPGVELSATATLQDLTSTTCRWPIGDPRSPDFGFCGRPHVPGQPYCAHHTARAYAPRPR